MKESAAIVMCLSLRWWLWCDSDGGGGGGVGGGLGIEPAGRMVTVASVGGASFKGV